MVYAYLRFYATGTSVDGSPGGSVSGALTTRTAETRKVPRPDVLGATVTKHKPWQPTIREDPLFNPFEPSTEWTRQIGDADRIEVPDDEEEGGESGETSDPGDPQGQPPAK